MIDRVHLAAGLAAIVLGLGIEAVKGLKPWQMVTKRRRPPRRT